jgi:hypothetical protein
MPIKKKTTAAKKPAVLGPKAKLMKLAVTTLRTKQRSWAYLMCQAHKGESGAVNYFGRSSQKARHYSW